MRSLRRVSLVAAFLCSGPLWPGPALRAAEDETAADAKLLKGVGLESDGPALLEFFRKRTLNQASQDRITALVRQLGDRAFRNRSQATAELIRFGAPALPALRQALKAQDVEVRSRADKCIKAIEQAPGPALPMAAARLLRDRKPADACPVLLAYLPFADDEDVAEEAVGTLLALGVVRGKADPALAAALQDKHPVRRAAAAYLLGRAGNAEQRQAVRRLLTDADVRVRFEAARGLLHARDRAALPVLVALLGEGPIELARKAEDLLGDVSGTQVTKVELSADAKVRRQFHAAWSAWLKANGDKIDLARVDVDNPLARANRARKVSTQCLNAMLNVDAKAFKKTLKFPFYMEGLTGRGPMNEAAARAQIDTLFEQLNKTPQIKEQMKQMSFAISRVGRLNDYAKNAQEPERTFLSKFRPTEVLIVYVKVAMKGQQRNEEGAIFVRMVGGQAFVVGFGSNRQAKSK
jgi:hypothetical protein